MNKKLTVLFVLLLIFQTITSGFAIPTETIAKGKDSNIITGISFTDVDGNDIDLENAEDGLEVNVHIDWSVEDVGLNEIMSDTIILPEKLQIVNEQDGHLLDSNHQTSLGTYRGTADGEIVIQVEPVKGIEKTEGTFVVEAIVNVEKVQNDDKKVENHEDVPDSDHESKVEDSTNKEKNVSREDNSDQGNQAISSNKTDIIPFSSGSVISENIITTVTLSQRFEDGTEDKELIPGELIELTRPYDDFKVTINYDFALPNNHGYKAGSTYVIKVPEQFKVQANPEPIELSNGEVVFGTFTSNNNNEIIIEFNEKIEGNSNISGFIKLESEFDQHYSTGPAEQEITFPLSDSKVVSYPVKFTPEASSISKEAEADQPYNTKEITWTVEFNKDLQTLTNATLHDTLEGNQEYIPDTIEVYELEMNIDGTIASEKKLSNNHFGASFPLTLGDVDKAYRIVYKTKIDEGDDGKTYKNNVKLTSDELKENPLTAQATVHVERGKPLEKITGEYDKSNQTVEWIVKYNYDEKSIEQNKAKLTDSLTGNHALVEDSFEVYKIEINQQTGKESSRELVNEGNNPEHYTLSPNPTGDGFTLQFNSDIDGAYEIKYKTKAIDRPGEGDTKDSNEIKNNISDEFGNNVPASTTITQQIFFKSHSGIDYKDKKVTWNISINEDKQKMEKVIFTDTLPKGFTVDGNGIRINHGESSLVEDEDYTLDYNEATGDIEIEFLIDITKVVKINYTTTFDYDDIITDQDENRKQSHTNEAQIQWEVEHTPGSVTEGKQEAGSTFNPDDFTKQNGFKNGNYNPVSKEISWKIGVNYNKETLDGVVVEDFIQGKQNFDLDSVKVYEMNLTGGRNGIEKGDPLSDDKYTIEPIDVEGEIVGFRVILGDIISPYLIEYKTDLNGLLVKESYNNTATVKSSNKDDFDLTAIVTPYEGGKYTDKHGEQNNENPRIVNWTVDINRSQSKMNDVVITDKLSKNQTLRKDSIRLYGTQVSSSPNNITKDENDLLEVDKDYTITFVENEDGSETFTLKFNESIEEAYVLEYDSYILYKGTGDDANFKNEFSLNGEGVESVTSKDPFSREIDISNISGGIVGEIGALIVTKVDADNPEEPLEGATFELYDSDGEFIRSGITNEEGQVTFQNLLYDRVYLLKETEAPEGYVKTNTDGSTIHFEKDKEELQIKNHKFVGAAELTKIDAETKEALEGVQFQLLDADKNVISGYENLFTNEFGKVTVEDLAPGDYFFKEVSPKYGYESLDSAVPFTIAVDQIEIQELDPVENNIILGSIELMKVDADNNNSPLVGVEFELQDEHGNVVPGHEKLITNNEGKITVDHLRPGTYYFVETKALEHYVLDNTPIEVTVELAQTDIVTIQVGNELITGAVELTKKGEDGKLLEGVVFEIQDQDGNTIHDNLTTDENGKLYVDDLKPGIYQFVEKQSIHGYDLNPKVEQFEIIKSQTATDIPKIEYTNDLTTGSVQLQKVDVDNGNAPLADAMFKLVYPNGTEVEGLTTDEDGKLLVEDLKPGKYQFIETEAPFGYELDDSPIPFTIAFGPTEIENVTHENEQTTGSVELTKIDTDNNEEPITESKAVFELQDAEGNTLQAGLDTDEDGKIFVDNLKPGDYQFIETEAPFGYDLNPTPIEFTIELGQTETLEVTAENERTTSSVELTKVDNETNEILPGAVFELRDGDGNTLQEELTTNEEGKILVSDLKPGNYQFVETEAPHGYHADSTPIPFTIDLGQTSTLNLTTDNSIIKGDFILTKVDFDDPSIVLEGVAFELRDADNHLLEHGLVTNEQGKIAITELRPGTYTLMETDPLFGYDAHDPIEFTINQGQLEAKELTIMNKLTRGSVELTKVDAANHEIVLENAQFELRDSQGNLLQENLSTNKDGEFIVEDLKPGNYQFVETEAPHGYNLDSTPIDFTIEKAQGYTERIVVENSKEHVAATTDNNFGKVLPKTSTNIFNLALSGIVLVVIGMTLYFIRRKRV